MSEDRDEAKQGSSGATWAVGLVAALGLYVLSVPLVIHWLNCATPNWATTKTCTMVLETIYAPLTWLESSSHSAHRSLHGLYKWETEVLDLNTHFSLYTPP